MKRAVHAYYKARNHSTLEGEALDVIGALSDIANITNDVKDGKFCGSSVAMSVALERAIIEAEDLLAKIQELEAQKTLQFTQRDAA